MSSKFQRLKISFQELKKKLFLNPTISPKLPRRMKCHKVVDMRNSLHFSTRPVPYRPPMELSRYSRTTLAHYSKKNETANNPGFFRVNFWIQYSGAIEPEWGIGRKCFWYWRQSLHSHKSLKLSKSMKICAALKVSNIKVEDKSESYFN